jgi:uncharacterized protein YycO
MKVINLDNKEKEISVKDFSMGLSKADIILSTSKGITGRVISFFTKSKFSHASIYAGDGKMIEANFKDGVVESDVSRLDNDKYSVMVVRTDMWWKKKDKIVNYAYGKIGEEYDKEQIFLYFWKIIRHRLGKSSMPDDRDKFVCYELVSRTFASEGIKFGSEIDSVIPQDIINHENTTVVNFN